MRTWGSPVALLVSLTALGCASVTGGRPGVPPRVRTITSIGDRALPVVSGEPGAAVASGTEEPQTEVTAARRVSGRIVDAYGQPVPGATVRLAVNGAQAGRSI